MRKIFKYTIPFDGNVHTLKDLPDGYVIHSEFQNGSFVFWFLFDPENGVNSPRFKLFATGEEIPADFAYVSTAQCQISLVGSFFVLHLFRQVGHIAFSAVHNPCHDPHCEICNRRRQEESK